MAAAAAAAAAAAVAADMVVGIGMSGPFFCGSARLRILDIEKLVYGEPPVDVFVDDEVDDGVVVIVGDVPLWLLLEDAAIVVVSLSDDSAVIPFAVVVFEDADADDDDEEDVDRLLLVLTLPS